MGSFYGIGIRKGMCVLAFLLLHLSVSAGNGPRFMENKGQYPKQVSHQLRVANAAIFFQHDRLVFNFYDADLLENHDHGNEHHHKHSPKTVNAHAYHVIFDGASPQSATHGTGVYGDLTNYFSGNDPSKWATDVHAYEQLHYTNLYPGIDLNYYGHEGNLKYDFIISPNADAAAIAMRYEGVDKIFLKNGQLHVTNAFNEVTEMQPVAYQIIDGERQTVRCNFKLDGTTVRFEFPEGYDTEHKLVIDPLLIFSSYSGAVSDNFGFTATYDNDGALYGGGISFGIDYPFVTGSYSNGFGGIVDMAITKFSADGSSLIYSTLIGGNSADVPHSMIVNSAGQLVILGSTSSTNFPTTSNAYDTGFNGGVTQNFQSNGTNYTNGADLVVVVLDALGSALTGSTYLGGSNNDGINEATVNTLRHNYGDLFRGEVIVDAADNIYITSSTRSTNIPVTTGVFDNTLSGTQDGYVAKLNSNVTTLLWATYLGGDSDDAGYSLKLNSVGELLVAGGTRGSGFPATTGALNTTYMGGAADGFVARIAADASVILSASYIGTSAYDQCYFVEVTSDDNVYLYGQTRGSYPVSSGVYSNTSGRQFIHKLTPDLSATLFSTVFGSGGANVNISPTAFLVDVCGRIYASGWGGGTNNGHNASTGNTNNLPITSNAYQTTTDGSDFYFIVLDQNATALVYATYFGSATVSEHVDGGTSRFNSAGVIHQAACAGCGASSSFPTTPNAWSNTNNSSNCNLGVVKLDMELASVTVDIQDISIVANPLGCAPALVEFDPTFTGNPQLQWFFGDGGSSGQSNPQHTYMQPGVYQIMLIATDSSTCQNITFADTAYSTVTINGIADPANAGSNREVCGQVPVVIGTPAIGGYTYSWSPAIGLTDPNSAQPSAAPTQNQVYALTVTDQNGCQDVDSVQVNVFAIQLSNDTAVCQNEVIQLAASANSPSTFAWTPSQFLNNPNIATPLATIASTTTFTVVADNGSCVDQADVTITSLDLPIADAGLDQAVCSGESAVITASGGTAYSWTPSATLNNAAIASPTATPSQTTVYAVNVSDANGCSATDNVTVTVNPLPTIVTTPTLEACDGGTVQLQANGAVDYVWEPASLLDNAFVADPVASPTQPTTFTVVGTDANGCVGNAVVQVSIFSVQASNNVSICPGTTANLSASGGVSWQWTPASFLNNATLQNPIATVADTTTFTVTATSATGCLAQDEVVVNTFAPAVANAGPDQGVCIGGSLTLSASGGTQYQWSPATFLSNPNIAAPTLTPTSDITYQLTVTDANGCSDTDDLNVAVNALPTVTAAPDVEVCENDNVQLQAGGAFSYSWSPTTGLDDPTSVSPLATVAATTTYTVTGTDVNGCVNTASATIDVFSVVVSNDTAVCPQETVQLTASNGSDWTWSPANLLNDPNAQNPIATVTSPTTFTVAVSNGQGCVLVRDVFVDVFAPATANAGVDQTACLGTSVALSASGGVAYQWSPATYLSAADVADPTSTPLQDITYQLTVIDANGCTDSDEVSLTVQPLPTVTIGPDQEICVGGSTQLAATGGVQYAWSPIVAMDDPNSATPTVSPSSPTTYTVVVTDANGCSDDASVSISIFTVTASVAPDATLCAGDSVQVTASGGTAFSWLPTTGVTQPDAQTTYITPTQSGTYVVTASASSGCTDTAEVELTLIALPIPAFEASFIPTCEGVLARFTNRTEGADQYHWSFSIPPDSLLTTDASFVFPNGQGPVVTLTATLEGSGCTATVVHDFSGQFFTNDSVEVFYPNVITPNDDGLNDCFKPGFTGAFSDCYELIVYNRWGALIFESVATGHCWDGRTKAGNLVPEGTYYYVTRVFEEEHAGWVQVILD